MLLIGDCAEVASCPMWRGGGFLPDAARRWLPARFCAAVASCPVLRGGGFLPDAARRWLLARCGAAVASLSSVVEWPEAVRYSVAGGWRFDGKSTVGEGRRQLAEAIVSGSPERPRQ